MNPMLTFYTAPHSELLLPQLLAVLKNQPLAHVFSREHFLVANLGMERWLAQRLAQQTGLFANYQFSLPEPFFQTLSRQLATQTPLLTPEQLHWQIEQQLRCLDEAVFQPLQTYLTGENQAIKRYQLATVLSQLFYRYQLTRPDLLQDWQHGQLQTQDRSEPWQQALWQRLIATHPHYQPLYQTTIAQLHQSPRGAFNYQLPERLNVFAISTLPAVSLALLQALAQHCEVHFYCLQPCVSAEIAHPLLASLGQQGQAFLQTGRVFPAFSQPITLSVTDEKNTTLRHLQAALAQDRLNPQPLAQDDSITIHACHSRMREVEVAKNRLLDCLEKHPTLQVDKIVILAPDIQVYAPYLHAVLNDIPHSISSAHTQTGQTVLSAFNQFLALCDSRFGWQAVLELLEHPVIYPSFELTEDDLLLIKHWVKQTQTRWGQSGEQKQQFELPPLQENTWQASLERLFMGYAVGQETEFVCDILPYTELEGSSAQALGGLSDFIQFLFTASTHLQQPRTLLEWGGYFQQAGEVLFTNVPSSERQRLYDLAANLAEQSSDAPIELAVMRQWLTQQITEQTAATGLLRGQLTCCSMAAVRGVPFEVIIVLGMNEGEFPRNHKSPTFDLIAQHPRYDDFSQRADERQQFLELLFAARQQLIITYLGQSLGQNQTIPPAVVLSELVEILENDYHWQGIIKQPLQAFSQRYFTGTEARLFSYSANDCATAQALLVEKQAQTLWWEGTLPPKLETVLELAELCSFYRHPQRYFLRRQLDLQLISFDNIPPEREPFALDPLESYAIYQAWIEALLNNQPFPLEKLQARGVWLAGAMGQIEFAAQQNLLLEFVATLKALNLGNKTEPLALDINCGQWRLMGKLAQRYEQGSLFYRYAPLKGKDFFIALLHHVLINQVQAETTYLVSVDSCLQLPPAIVNPELFTQLVELFVQGQQSPTAFFPDSVLEYMKQAVLLKNSSRASKPALAVAQEKWLQTLEQPYQVELNRLFAGLTEVDSILDAEFVRLCETVFLPVWEACQSSH